MPKHTLYFLIHGNQDFVFSFIRVEKENEIFLGNCHLVEVFSQTFTFTSLERRRPHNQSSKVRRKTSKLKSDLVKESMQNT